MTYNRNDQKVRNQCSVLTRIYWQTLGIVFVEPSYYNS